MENFFEPVATWTLENWLIVALVLSEVAAFLPKKWNGIIQIVVKIGGKLFESKVSKPKKL